MLVVRMNTAGKPALREGKEGTRGLSQERGEMKELMLSIVLGVSVPLTFTDVSLLKGFNACFIAGDQ